ncbi:MAG: hypothetical protein HQM09_21105 [Candidatus Riflebacteria bacterium]|nr:hypothetical protein [Candidatus Riflebacteria bacterium]
MIGKKYLLCCLIVVLFLGVFSEFPLYAHVRGDFDGNGVVNVSDVILMLAWIQTRKSTDITKVTGRANEILSDTYTVAYLPDNSIDDYDGNNTADISDVVLMLAWIQTRKSTDPVKVSARATEILSTVVSTIGIFPETELGSSTIPISITGITPN